MTEIHAQQPVRDRGERALAQSGSETATRIESAIVSRNSEAFLSEVNGSRGNLSNASATEATRRLERDGLLPQVIGLQADNIYRDANRRNYFNHDLTRSQIDAYANRPGLSALDRQLARHVSANFDRISQGDNGISRSDLDAYLNTTRTQASMREFFRRNQDGRSLYSDVADTEGNIRPGALRTRLQDTNLTPAQRQALEHVRSQTTTYASLNPWANDMTGDQVRRMAVDAGLNPNDISRRTGDVRQIAANRQTDHAATADSPARRDALTTFFRRDRNGRSLYSDVADSEGNIRPAALRTRLEDQSLSNEQRTALQHLQSEMTTYRRLNPWANDMTKDHVRQLALSAGLNADDVTRRTSDASRIAAVREQQVTPAQADTRHRREAQELLRRDRNGRNILSDVMDRDGNVSWDRLKQEKDKAGISNERRAALEWLGNQFGRMDRSLSADQVRRSLQATGLDANDTNRRIEGAQRMAGAQREVGNPNQPAARATDASETQLRRALTVGRGEGYAQAAGRLLEMAGVDNASGRQISELTQQLRAANPTRGSLRQGQVLELNDQIRNNQSLQNLFGTRPRPLESLPMMP